MNNHIPNWTYFTPDFDLMKDNLLVVEKVDLFRLHLHPRKLSDNCLTTLSQPALENHDFFWLYMGITARIRELGGYGLSLTKGALYRWSYGSIKLVLRRDAMPDKFWCRLPQKICAVTSSLAEI